MACSTSLKKSGWVFGSSLAVTAIGLASAAMQAAWIE